MKMEISKVRSCLLTSFVFVVVVAFFHFVGGSYGLYYIVPWYDSLVHFLAGISVGFFALWAWYVSLIVLNKGHLSDKIWFELSWIFSVTFVVAFVWEIFEFSAGITSPGLVTPAGFTFLGDASKDISLALFGAGLARLVSPKGKRG